MIKTFNFSPNGLSESLTYTSQQVCLSQQDAFTCLHAAYIGRVQDYVNFRVADEHVAEDITAQVFVDVWEKLPGYQSAGSPIISWLYSLAQSAIDDYYLTKMTTPPADGLNSPLENSRETVMQEQTVLQVMSSDQFPDALAEPADQQPALTLGFIGEDDAPEIFGQNEAQTALDRVLKIRALKELVNYLAPKEREYTRVDSDVSLYSFV